MIYIVRHGQTEKNKANVLQGRSDVPLNEAGRQQAEEVRDRFREAGISFDLVYTSPLIRAVQTAEIIAGRWVECPCSVGMYLRKRGELFFSGRYPRNISESSERSN